MAALASTAVTILHTYRYGGTSGKRTLFRRFKLDMTSGVGGLTNSIDASTLGFTEIEGCTNLYNDDTETIFPAAVIADGSKIVLSNPTQATDASRADVADVTISSGFGYISVWGR